MKKLIIGATGSIGSALSKKLVSQGKQVHLVGRNESETSALAKELNSTFTVADVLTENYSDQIISDAGDIDGLAFCVGSIDLKPINLISHEGLLRNTRFYEKREKYFKGNNYTTNLKRIHQVLSLITNKQKIYYLIFIRKQTDILPSYFSNF